ncbi:MAG: DUF4240 domain-containing protein [Saprospiraceae bacterium]
MTQITFSIPNDQDAELLLSLAKRLNAEVVEIQSNDQLSEIDFWKLIAQIDLSDTAWEADTATDKLVKILSQKSVATIQQFQDILAAKLFALDKKLFAQQLAERYAWQLDQPFSSDHFLYARAYVIAQGKYFYEKVLKNPALMPQNEVFEELLYVAATAYEKKTGEAFNYIPSVSFETFSNPDGWEKTLTERLNSPS